MIQVPEQLNITKIIQRQEHLQDIVKNIQHQDQQEMIQVIQDQDRNQQHQIVQFHKENHVK